MSNPQTDTPWMTTEVAAKYLSVSPGTMNNWRSKGTGPSYRTVGRIVRYHRDDLDAFMMSGASDTTRSTPKSSRGRHRRPGEHLMTDHLSQITFVRPGGVATKVFADGAETMRVCLGYLHDPDDGLLAEMNARHEPVPWQSARVRDEAIGAVERRIDLEDETRFQLLEWIAATPYFEDA